jgi:hypothetical protein
VVDENNQKFKTMNTRLKLLHVVIITLLLVSCGGNDRNTDAPFIKNTLVKENKMTEVLKQKPVIYATAESFDYSMDASSEFFNITTVVISADNMNCTADAKLCEEISAFIGANKLVFSSSEEHALIEEELPEYRMMQKGTIELNNDTYSATLYYSGEDNGKAAPWFRGRLVFLPAVTLLKGKLLILEIKGKK